LFDNFYSNFLIDFLTFLDIRNNLQVMNNILKLVTNVIEDDYKANNINCILSHIMGHFVINRLIKKILKDHKNKQLEFIRNISNILKLNLSGFLETKAIFIINNIVENQETKPYLFNELKVFQNTIQNKGNSKDCQGYKVLSEIIK